VSKPKPRPIDVEIYDQKYTIVLQTCLEEAEVRSIADELDLRMRELAAVASTADSLKIAILTALHLAQELRDLRKDCDQKDALINSKAAEWSRTLEQLLRSS
jgi:cell division protein ZapA (FtsZ GTPase activity inhibitor)